MESQGLVSVIIPSYNRGHVIDKAVDSVLAQNYPALEILIIDDGSQDNTAKVIQEKFGTDSRIRYFAKKNGGVSSARNLGMKESRGQYVAFLDSDDTWLPGKLSAQIRVLNQLPQVGMVWTEMRAVNSDRKVLHERYLRLMYRALHYFPKIDDLFSNKIFLSEIKSPVYYGDIYSQMVLGNLVHTSTVVMRRDRMIQTGEFREEFKTGEDYPFFLKACREGPVAFIDQVFIDYLIGEGDTLTSPAYQLQAAQNYLATFEASLLLDRYRIVQPQDQLDQCLAGALGWIGRSYLGKGDFENAKKYLLKSLRVRVNQPEEWKALLKCFIGRK